ncbi:ABC transporter substrate-binding protein [Anaerotruncus rubiinfantis]|uniref:ABC transporter substrate-binding protein n=1 Tax=Anaerotruncus rubiinfantis TaxID=1720200 RepID=UPI0018992BA6|nr:ABC transporter substrate-binding protein [Anaerotruncus rubiinfantis]
MRKTSTLSRILAMVLTMAVLAGFLAGCGGAPEDHSLSILIPNRSIEPLMDKLTAQDPDITFDVQPYFGSAVSVHIQERFERNDLPDIILATYAPEDSTQKENLLDISGYGFVQNYKASVLSNLSVDGSIYMLEGPTTARGIAYNKTLFAERGWAVPTNHEEFISLVKTIRAETDMLPLTLPGLYSGTYFTLMSELSHCDFLMTADGVTWAQKFAQGEASSREGFGTGITLLKDWVDAGAFEVVQADMSDQQGVKMLVGRECAMTYLVGGQPFFLGKIKDSTDEFGTFPLYGLGGNSEFCATNYGIKIGLNKRLNEPGNEKKLENALKLLELFSSEEGQELFRSSEADILPLAGTTAHLPEEFIPLNEAMNRGHAAPFLYPGYEDLLAFTGEYLREAVTSGSDLDKAFELMDSIRQDTIKNQYTSNALATVSQDLTTEQTVRLVANALYATGLGDIALCTVQRYTPDIHLVAAANGKYYQGNLDTTNIDIPIGPRYNDPVFTNDMTGAEIKQLMETGLVVTNDAGITDYLPFISAGLDPEKLNDGENYKVVFSPSDCGEKSPIEKAAVPSDIVWKDFWREYIIGLGTITPDSVK